MNDFARRREREDRISSLMGEYLLKGYKMLGSTCSDCDVRSLLSVYVRPKSPHNIQTILMQDKHGTNYCIGCKEVDSQLKTPENESTSRPSDPVPVSSAVSDVFSPVVEALKKQIVAAATALDDDQCGGVLVKTQLCHLIRDAADAIVSLHKASNSRS